MSNDLLNNDRELDELIRRSAQMEVPGQVEERLRRRLQEFQTKIEQRPPSRFEMLVCSLTHPRAFRVPAMAAVVLAAAFLALVIIPG